MSKRGALTALIVQTYRFHGALNVAGDKLVSDIGLTSARWQVLGAIAMRQEPAPVVRLAEAMGLARQSVQRIVDELAAEGVLAFADNPRHRRAKLVKLTAKGGALFSAAMKRQAPWAERLAAIASGKEIEQAASLVARLCDELDRQRDKQR
jgi:DNA-binding MarR family transcriptional regulator